MKKILFVAEAVSLAHVARPSVLAGALSTARYEIVFASNGAYGLCTAGSTWAKYRIEGISSELFMKRLAQGSPVYSEEELQQYVESDLRMLEEIKPDLVVGDFRLSLAISARLLKIPLIVIGNAYWSAFANEQRMLAPDLPAARLLGFTVFDPIFRAAWPFASRLHTAPINRVRKRFGLKPYRSIREYYGDGDVVLYCDTPGLVPCTAAPASHHFIGPVVWSPSVELPIWWAEAMAVDRPRVYITLGSTGDVDLLPKLVEACVRQGLVCLVATAGRTKWVSSSQLVFSADFLPGNLAAAASSLVVCNGGSPTAHQALKEGVPVLGICSNLDQVLNMVGVCRVGAGLSMRAGEFSVERVSRDIGLLQTQGSFALAAQQVQGQFRALNALDEFPRLVGQMLC